MSSLGIYFGPKAIGIVETKGRNLIHNIQIPQSVISSDELEERVPLEVKAIEIVALFKDELRRNKVEAKDATICLSGKDLIIRNFEIPVLPRNELASAINFEAKKYIPFKVEDLISAFQLKFNKASRTNLVLFMGIKKEILDRYLSIVNQLEVKINTIEYSAFSLLRCLKLAGLSDSGIIGILGADLNSEDEVNFVVLENGFPLFSRDISLTSGPEGLVRIEETEPGMILEKLKTEIRVSLDYYSRKFSTKNIKKILYLANQDYHSDLEAFMAELGLSAKAIDITSYLGKSIPYSLSFIKAYCSSLYKAVKIKVELNLLEAKEKVRYLKEQVEGIVPTELPFPLKYFLRLDYRVLTLCVLICIAAYSLGFYRKFILQQRLNNIVSMRAQVSTVNPETDYEELNKIDSGYKEKLNNLDNIIKKQFYFTEPLNIIARVLPEGVWLTRLYFNKTSEYKAELILEGWAFLVDSEKEYETVNKFITNLKATPGFNKYFKEININSLERRQLDKFTMTSFFISCRTS